MWPATLKPGSTTLFMLAPATTAQRVFPPGPSDWPTLWARCWSRIRSWQAPPRWTTCEWREEARAQGALAACEALRVFNPTRLVPLDAFLYRRVVESVWTRYRQEWAFGRRCRPDAALAERAAAWEPEPPGSDILGRLSLLLDTLDGPERRLLRQIFWDGQTEESIAAEIGVSRQAVNKRKQKLLERLKSGLELGGAG